MGDVAETGDDWAGHGFAVDDDGTAVGPGGVVGEVLSGFGAAAEHEAADDVGPVAVVVEGDEHGLRLGVKVTITLARRWAAAFSDRVAGTGAFTHSSMVGCASSLRVCEGIGSATAEGDPAGRGVGEESAPSERAPSGPTAPVR
ncbi:hypothetical protein [Streptomyces monashensis]|uniref:hypothetical protein n=1 Tax=Streptomyces monashensis TaxID=1678012 RepID=UPI0011607DFA|nr:hypothetical protein [Streptomyces monashensis]